MRWESKQERYLGGIPKKELPQADKPSFKFKDVRPIKPPSKTKATYDPHVTTLRELQTEIGCCLRDGRSIPVETTRETLSQSFPNDASGTTPLHVAASKGQLGQLPVDLVSPDLMLIRDAFGRTPLHRAVSSNSFEKVPDYLLSPEGLSAKDRAGLSTLDVLIKKNLISHLPEDILSTLPEITRIAERALLDACESRNFLDPVFRNFQLLSKNPSILEYNGTWFHWLAEKSLIKSLPKECLPDSVLDLVDSFKRTPFHSTIIHQCFAHLPEHWKTCEHLVLLDTAGRTRFHYLANTDQFGGAPIPLFTRKILLTKDFSGQSVADVVEAGGRTNLLPESLRYLSITRARQYLDDLFQTKFTSSKSGWRESVSDVIGIDEFQDLRNRFVQKWSRQYPDLGLDEEQAGAVAESGTHLQVTARAGSGKTRTLVARALFQITHCRIPPSSLLILAFNKKAVGEIEKRLGAFLSEEQMPHILTFHALAHRVVRPQEDLIYDEGDTKEGQVFSATIQCIIDKEMRGGSLERELRALMEIQWKADLDRIIEGGFNLQPDEFLEFRKKLPKMTIDGRRVRSEAQKHVANTLLRLGIHYSYRRTTHRYAGKKYAPDFSHYNKDKESGIVFEILELGARPTNPAREAFWRSGRSSNTLHVEIPEDACEDPLKVSELISEALKDHGVTAVPMSDDELWKSVRDRAIDSFTKAVKQFISRCQKELLNPESLFKNIEKLQDTCNDLQERFWILAADIFTRYREALANEKKTDFDQLMLRSAVMIKEGNTRFSSSRGSGNLSSVKHVLIDEFQDFSHLFNELRKAFIAQSPEALFFCVGDDWQAINKFAGSDLHYFTEFQNSFNPSVGSLISRNYRSCSRIVEAGNAVMSGEGSPSIANKDEPGNIHIIDPNVAQFSYSEAEEIVVEELGEHSVSVLRIVSEQTSRGLEVAVLSRTGSIATPEGILKLAKWERKLRGFLPEENGKLLSVSTTHGYKGKEADAVVLLGPENYPSIHPDAIFNTIFGDTFESNVADEKRLFYVGVTRAKSSLFLIRDLWDGEVSHSPLGTFLDLIPNQSRYDIGSVSANLVCVGRVIIRLENKPKCQEGSGTFPIHKKLKAEGYKWSGEKNAWSLFLEPGSISSPRECSLYLLNQKWIKEAAGVVATFVWENQRHRILIDGGRVTSEGSSSPLPVNYGFEKKPEHTEPVAKVEQTQPRIPPQSDAGIQPRQQAPATPSTGVFETGVVGMRYGGGMENARHLSTGDFVRLQREPGNPYDRNAILVMTSEGAQLGYVSAKVAGHLARGLDAWGGAWQAKVSSVWKQPPPNFLVSIQICFPLPPNVVIPRELDANAQLDDNPFGTVKAPTTKSPAPAAAPTGVAVPDPVPPPSENNSPHDAAAEPEQQGLEALVLSESLSLQQREDLESLLDPSLGPLIAEMYLSGLSDWPEIGYEGKDANAIGTGSMLEVAWLDFKIGIALASNDVGSFDTSGWTILPAATATVAKLRDLFSAADDLGPPTRMTQPAQNTPHSATNVPAYDPGASESDQRYKQGPFMDEEPDDDVPY
jgi:DNA helicase IV